MTRPLPAFAATLLLFASCTNPNPPVDTSRIVAADTDPENWLTHGRTYAEQRYSPLTAINHQTIGRLGLAWEYEMRTSRGASGTPLVVDGVLYATSAWSLVYALDARSGAELWVWDPDVEHSVGAKACCDVTNRGVAVYGDKVYVGVIDGRLAALDRRTGSLVWETMTVDPDQPYTITGAPRAANGLVYIGNGGAEFGVRGYVSAYDAETGELAWRFYTVPGNPADGPDGAVSDSILATVASTWTGEWWQLGGGGTVWDAIVYDAEFDQVLIGVGNGAPWNQQIRSPGGGDNLFLSSIVALDARTGAYRWHYQTTPGDTWDYTATQSIILAELTIEGTPRPVAMQMPKNGFFYVIDRRTGEFISGTPVVPMFPTAETPPGFPLSWAYAIGADGRPIENPEARYVGSTRLVRPGALGAHNWHPMAYSPETGLVYIPVQEVYMDYTTDTAYTAGTGLMNLGITMAPFPEDPQVRTLLSGSVSGYLAAWDPVARREVWRLPRRGPWNGGTVATAGGLVFQGTADGLFQAVDGRTGEVLWEHDNQMATLAGPISYQVDGEQYVTVLAGFGSLFYLLTGALVPKPGAKVRARVYTFKLDGNATVTPVVTPSAMVPEPPALAASPTELRRGAVLFSRYCVGCHGIGAISGGVLPDVRYSPVLRDADGWREIVSEGTRAAMGMPGYGDLLTSEDAELLRAYVARQARLARESVPSGGDG